MRMLTRQQYFERGEMSYDDKQKILEKSDNKCCHCGKIKFINYGATIDHFIPISKGGSDKDYNKVMLCDECNQAKGNDIKTVSYLTYLKPEYKDELAEYVKEYIDTMEYVDRKHLFAFDEYEIVIDYCPYDITRYSPQKQKTKRKSLRSTIKVKRATSEDFDRVCDYFEKYYKKYGIFGSREAVEIQTAFWMKFGSINYVEKNGEIFIIIAITVATSQDKASNYIKARLYSYYSTDFASNFLPYIGTKLISNIAKENDLAFLPVYFGIYKGDKLCAQINRYFSKHSCNNIWDDNIFIMIPVFVDSRNTSDLSEEEYAEEFEKQKSFLKDFEDINRRVVEYLKKYGSSIWLEWQAIDFLSADEINKLETMGKVEKEFVEGLLV